MPEAVEAPPVQERRDVSRLKRLETCLGSCLLRACPPQQRDFPAISSATLTTTTLTSTGVTVTTLPTEEQTTTKLDPSRIVCAYDFDLFPALSSIYISLTDQPSPRRASIWELWRHPSHACRRASTASQRPPVPNPDEPLPSRRRCPPNRRTHGR